MKLFIKLVCLYLGVIIALIIVAQSPSDMGGPIKVEYEYQQF